MTSISLFFDSRKAQEKSENFITTFYPPLQLDINKNYEVSLINAQIWYSWHNITTNNNNFIYSIGKGNSKQLKIHLVVTILKILIQKSSI